MDAAVLDELGERQVGGLAADVVEGADDDDAGRVVDDDVNAGGLLEGADVATFAADDPALHVVRRDIDGADGGVGGVLGGVALDGRGQNLTRLLIGLRLEKLGLLMYAAGDFVGQFLIEPLEQGLLGLLAIEAADLVQALHLLLDQRLDFLSLFVEVFTALVKLALVVLKVAFLFQLGLMLLFQQVFAFLQAALLLALLVLGLLDLAVELFALVEGLVFGAKVGLLAQIVGVLLGLGDDVGGTIPGAVEVEALLPADKPVASSAAKRQSQQSGQADPYFGHGGHSFRGPPASLCVGTSFNLSAGIALDGNGNRFVPNGEVVPRARSAQAANRSPAPGVAPQGQSDDVAKRAGYPVWAPAPVPVASKSRATSADATGWQSGLPAPGLPTKSPTGSSATRGPFGVVQCSGGWLRQRFPLRSGGPRLTLVNNVPHAMRQAYGLHWTVRIIMEEELHARQQNLASLRTRFASAHFGGNRAWLLVLGSWPSAKSQAPSTKSNLHMV